MILEVIVERAAKRDRYMVAVAGPPGAGKSTFSRDLVRMLPPRAATVVEMDGFHYDNAVLDAAPLHADDGLNFMLGKGTRHLARNVLVKENLQGCA